MRTSPEAGSKRVLRLVVLCVVLALWTLVGPPPASATEEVCAPTPDKLKEQLAFEIDDPRVAVEVIAVNNRRIVTLTGTLNTEQEGDEIFRLVESKVPNCTEIRRRFFFKKPAGAKDPEKEITDLWILTYIRSRVSSTSGTPGATGSASSTDNVELLVDALNQIYGSGGSPAVQKAGVGRLLLRGTPSTVLDIKRFLALIDAPWPQVQMNLWAVQVSGSRKEVAKRTEEIGRQVRAVRDQMQEVQRALARIVVDDLESNKGHWDFVRRSFDAIGVSLAADGPLSLNESLILLTLHPQRERKVGDLQAYATNRWPAWEREWREATSVPGSGPDGLRVARQAPAAGFFNRLRDAFATSSYEADRRGFFRFAESLYCFKDRKKWRDRPDAPAASPAPARWSTACSSRPWTPFPPTCRTSSSTPS